MSPKVILFGVLGAIYVLFGGLDELVNSTFAQESNLVSAAVQNPQMPALLLPPGTNIEIIPLPEPSPVPAAKIDRQELIRQADELLRVRRAEILKELGCEVDWTRYSNAELLDIELRIRKGKELQRLGSTMNWSTATYDEMCDKERRLLKIATLEKAGLSLYWTRFTYAELCNLDARIKKAQRLRKLGKDVSWQEYSLDQLNGFETRVWNAHPGGL